MRGRPRRVQGSWHDSLRQRVELLIDSSFGEHWGDAVKKGYFVGAVVVLLALVGGWYWGSPRYTLHQMKAAAEAGDSDKLASYIDFPAVRTSLKEELKAQAAAAMTKTENKGFAAIGAAFAMNMVDGMVDGMVTPTTMRKVFAANKQKGPEGITKVDATREDLVIDRNGLDSFMLHPAKGKASEAGLVFMRHGLGWQLSALRIPAE